MSNLNLHRSGGPTTAIGKKRSSRNARRHGLFASEFSLSAADEIEFTKLTANLREELKPNNPLLELIFQDLVSCAWRMRIALRCEQCELQKEFAIENEGSQQEPSGVGVSFSSGPKVGRSQECIKMLDALYNRTVERGCLPPELEEPVTQICGPELWKILAQWPPVNPVGVLMGRLNLMTLEREELFGCESSMPDLSEEEKKQIFDANALRELELICKLIKAYKQVLLTASSSVEKGSMFQGGRESRLDLFVRYSTTARRDFYRSVREYKEAMILN